MPVGGFAYLQGDRGVRKTFELRSIAAGENVDPNSLWPRSHTCFNRLDLSAGYTSRRILRQVLHRVVLLEANDAFTIS